MTVLRIGSPQTLQYSGSKPTKEDAFRDSMNITIGGVKIWLDFNIHEQEIPHDIVMTHVLPLVPPSVISLKLDDSKLNWREYFKSHLEMRSIEHSKFS